MTRRILRGVQRVLLPDGIILGVALGVVWLVDLPASAEAYVDVFGGAVLLTGVALGLQFRRHRFFFGLIVLALTDVALNHVGGTATVPVSAAAALLLPLNLTLLAIVRNRGPRQAFVLAAVVGLQVLAVAVTAWPFAALSDSVPRNIVTGMHPGDVVLWVVAAASLVVALALAVRWEPKRRGFLWAILAVPAAVNASAAGDDAASAVVLVSAGILLVIAAMEDVHVLAYSDELTDLPSRRALSQYLERLGDRYAIGMVDVDRFKAFNDRWGHDAGDQTLRMVAERLRHVGGGGRAFRYGGEEFTVVFSGLTLEEALPHLERLRESVAARPFTPRHDGTPPILPRRGPADGAGSLTVTVSIGAAGRNGRGGPPSEVLKAADRALYRAKEAGRNRVVI